MRFTAVVCRLSSGGLLSLLTLVWAVLIAGMLWQGATRALEGAVLQSAGNVPDWVVVVVAVALALTGWLIVRYRRRDSPHISEAAEITDASHLTDISVRVIPLNRTGADE